jgi:hypothetical protein
LLCSAAATVPVTPAPAVGVVPAGTVTAGHTGTHGPVQELIPFLSVGNAYRANPCALARTVPKFELVAAVTVAPAANAVDAEAIVTTAVTPRTLSR